MGAKRFASSFVFATTSAVLLFPHFYCLFAHVAFVQVGRNQKEPGEFIGVTEERVVGGKGAPVFSVSLPL